MKTNNLTIRSKLMMMFTGIFVLLLILILFMQYQTNLVKGNADLLSINFQELIAISDIGSDTTLAANSHNLAVLTQDPVYEDLYDEQMLDLDEDIELVLNQLGENHEREQLLEFQKLLDSISSVELLALSYAKEGNVSGALGLFKNETYINDRQAANVLIKDLVAHEEDEIKEFIIDNADLLAKTRVIVGAIMVAFIVSTFFIIWLTTYSVTSRIKKLVEAASDMADGNYNQSLIIRGKDEISDLTHSFNDMASQVRDSHSGLEDLIQERTSELVKAKSSLEQEVRERTEELEQAKGTLEEQVAQRTNELEHKIIELEKMNKLMIDRELKMVELKKQVEELAGSSVS